MTTTSLFSADDLMHGEDFNFDQHKITGWIVQEKLDGWRTFWDGSQLRMRNGDAFSCPQWFIQNLPPGLPLDGELYAGPYLLKKVQQIAGSRNPSDRWMDLKFLVFDAPTVAGGYMMRWNMACTAIREKEDIANERFVKMIPPLFTAMDVYGCLLTLKQVQEMGGEGLVLRDPFAHYMPGRTEKLLKLKK